MSKNVYDESSIKVLKGLLGVRKRPTMYIGNVDADGLFQCVKEIIDNGIDECSNGYSKSLKLIVDKEFVTVADTGRGIPVGIHPDFKKEKLSTLEVIMTQLHAGGKMDTDSYTNSVGRNGVGVSVSNALAERFNVWTYRDRKWWFQSYSKGKPTTKVVNKNPPFKQSKGTIVQFKPDFTIFKKGSSLDLKRIKELFSFNRYLIPGVEFQYEDKINNKSKTYISNKGLKGLLQKQVKDLGVEDLTTIFEHHSSLLDVVFQWVKNDDYEIKSFVNGSPTAEGGTHVKCLQSELYDWIMEFAPSKSNFKADDILEGLYAIINLKYDNPLFDSQTKDRLTNKEIAELIEEDLADNLKKWAKINKESIQEIIDRASAIRDAKAQYEQTKKAIAAVKGKRGKSSLPGAKKFAGCTCKNASDIELYILEGDSALGTARVARDPKYQEVLCLRGKILNAEKDKVQKVFESEEVVNILKAIGYDPENKKLTFRVGKVILLADADSDGSHIECLVSTLIQKLCPELIKRNMLYTVDAPLYVGRTDTKIYYGGSLSDLKKQCKTLKSVTRIKGWGECSPSLLRDVAFSKNAVLVPITESKGKDLKEALLVMGDDSQARKKLLSERLG